MSEGGDVSRNTSHRQYDLNSPGSLVNGRALWELHAPSRPPQAWDNAERRSVRVLFRVHSIGLGGTVGRWSLSFSPSFSLSALFSPCVCFFFVLCACAYVCVFKCDRWCLYPFPYSGWCISHEAALLIQSPHVLRFSSSSHPGQNPCCFSFYSLSFYTFHSLHHDCN